MLGTLAVVRDAEDESPDCVNVVKGDGLVEDPEIVVSEPEHPGTLLGQSQRRDLGLKTVPEPHTIINGRQ